MNKILSAVFSLSGASIAIGALGFMSGIVSLFIDVESTLSIKWFLFICLLLISFIIILLKLVYDLSEETAPPPPYEAPIRYVPDEQVFVIRRNENFINNIVVGCYITTDEIDRLAYLGVVHLVQDRVIQIKIRFDFKILENIPESADMLKNIVVRPVVPVTALQQLSNLENIDD
jgi:hypothetical protein